MGRSRCSSCNKVLSPLELVPILSFFLLNRRCRGCKARLSWQYPLVELWSALTFITVFSLDLSLIGNILLLFCFSLYIAITVYDLRHQIIPDALVYASILLAFCFRFLIGGEAMDYLAGPLLALAFAAIWLFSKGRAMGFGDSKLALSIGLLLGGALGVSAIILAFWLGAGVGLILVIFNRFYPLSGRAKGITIKSAIPFAPFLVFGAWFSLIFHLDLLHASIF
jgi:prepilin signal peptidase PulO-like enzyme (type II secretory pathway)